MQPRRTHACISYVHVHMEHDDTWMAKFVIVLQILLLDFEL